MGTGVLVFGFTGTQLLNIFRILCTSQTLQEKPARVPHSVHSQAILSSLSSRLGGSTSPSYALHVPCYSNRIGGPSPSEFPKKSATSGADICRRLQMNSDDCRPLQMPPRCRLQTFLTYLCKIIHSFSSGTKALCILPQTTPQSRTALCWRSIGRDMPRTA